MPLCLLFDMFAFLIHLQEHFQVSFTPFLSVPHALHPALNIINYFFNCWGLSEKWASVRPGNIADVQI